MFAHAYGYASCLWESFYSREWESIPWSTSRQPSLWPTGTACPLHMVFPSPGRATAGTEQQGTRSCPGSGSQRIRSKTLLQETKSESIASINHICVLLKTLNAQPWYIFYRFTQNAHKLNSSYSTLCCYSECDTSQGWSPQSINCPSTAQLHLW